MNNSVLFVYPSITNQDEEDVFGYTPRNLTESNKHISEVLEKCEGHFSYPANPYIENEHGVMINCRYVSVKELLGRKVYMYQIPPSPPVPAPGTGAYATPVSYSPSPRNTPRRSPYVPIGGHANAAAHERAKNRNRNMVSQIQL
uniref:Uncharacterized protein n=1 Tax=viral metagenome TaxID=1070528 RepID=A0A6C0CLL8_9ZZZZ